MLVSLPVYFCVMVTVEAKMLGWLSSKKDAGLTARLFLCDGYSSKK